MEACLAGDEVAWRELVTRYARLVYSVTRRNGMDPLAAEDVFQEVFFILLRQLPRIRRQSGLPKWLLTTTHRVCRQWYDRTERSAPLPRALLDEAAPPPELAELLERQHLVRLALRRLGGRCQELLTALYAEPGPVRYDEIAHKLDMPEGSIGPTRARCLQKLMAVLVSMERGS